MPGQDSHYRMMDFLLFLLQTIFLIRSLHVNSQSIASTRVIFDPLRTQGLGFKTQNFGKTVLRFGCFSLKVVYNSCKLQRLFQVAKFLFMYYFTCTNIVFLFRHLPMEIVLFINVCYQMKCFSGDSFSFF